MAINTGGSAFPTQTVVYENGQVQYGDNGMTLRDYFAIRATEEDLAKYLFTNGHRNDTSREQARWMFADAMLKERYNEQRGVK